MSMSRSRASRVFTVSFPEDLAQQVEKLAQQESRNISELFREAFRSYRLERIHRKLDTVRGKTRGANRPTYTEDDVERLVDEIRAELSGNRKTKL
jgi:metal-responsive CopG/Arc/MetJ family transcriptional regulator